MSITKMVIYAGRGASHSWTWLADLFEGNCVLNVRFLDSEEFISSLVSAEVNLAIISGGDGFAIADALKGRGFRHLEEFIYRGGRFVGICAGAYLPLPSTVEPFSSFNISRTKIENISCETTRGGEKNPREATPYWRCSIVHPIRGAVGLSDGVGHSVIAPLYGGPVFKEPDDDIVLMRYRCFTTDTEFQKDRATVEAMMLEKPAVIKVAHGSGELLLFGPHLEHPGYPQANSLFLKLLHYDRSVQAAAAAIPVKSENKDLQRAVSDLKVAILGLENRSFTVGRKVWDGSRLLEIVSAIEKRGWTLTIERSKLVVSHLSRVRDIVLGMSVGVSTDTDEVTTLLIDAARTCVDNHFAVLSGRAMESSVGRAKGNRLKP